MNRNEKRNQYSSASLQQWLTLLGLLVALLLSGCKGAPPARSSDADSGPNRIPAGVLAQSDPVPKDEPLSASGNSLSYVVFGKRYYRLASARNFDETGVASWYGRKFHGRLTASGEPYDMYSMTAAHKSIPLPTYARVTNLANDRSVIVRINDRGPFVGDRLIDLSYAAAAKLDMLNAGTARVRVVTLSGVPGEHVPAQSPSSKTQVAAVPLVTIDRPYVKPYRDPQPVLHVPTTQPEPAVQTQRGLQTGTGTGTGTATATGVVIPANAKPEGQLLLLQIGAYGSFSAADELRARVDGSVAGDVFVSKRPDSTLFRVRIGPFTTDSELAAVRVMLRERHSIDAIVVPPTEAQPSCC